MTEPEQKRLHIHRFTIDEKAKHPKKGLLYYKRKFIHVYSRGKKIFAASNETIIRTPRLDFGLRMRIGNKGSETPWNYIIQFFGITMYLSFGRGRRFAHWITSRKNGWHHRELGFYTFGEEGETPTLYWHLWYNDDRSDYNKRPRRRGSISLSPAEWLWGPLRYRYENIAKFDTDIEMKEGSYPATITLQRMTRGRENQRTKKFTHIQEAKYTLDVDVPKGVPSHYDKSGGWKGDRTHGFGVAFSYPRAGYITTLEEFDYTIQVRGVPEWHIDAKAAVEAWVYTERARTGFREPQEVE